VPGRAPPGASPILATALLLWYSDVGMFVPTIWLAILGATVDAETNRIPNGIEPVFESRPRFRSEM